VAVHGLRLSDQGRSGPLCECDGITRMVAMIVGQQNEVGGIDIVDPDGGERIAAQPRVDENAGAGGRRDLPAGMAKPFETVFGHVTPPLLWARCLVPTIWIESGKIISSLPRAGR